MKLSFPRGRPPLWLVGAFIAGLVLQVSSLAMRGTSDVAIFKQWALSTLDRSFPRIYSQPATPRPDALVPYAQPDYPPGSVALLAVAASVARWIDPDLNEGSRILTFLVKAPALLVRLGVFLLIVALSWQLTQDERQAWMLGLAHWLNPALMLSGSTLGYLDPLCWGPGIVAVVLAASHRARAAGVVLGLTLLVKHQGVFFVLPVLALLWRSPGMMTCFRWTVAVALAGVAPFLIFGDPEQFVLAMQVNAQGGMLSGDALNLWWIVTAAGLLKESGLAAMDMPMRAREIWWTQWGVVEILRVSTGLLVGGVAVWATLRVRKVASLPGAAALGAFSIHTYFVMAVGVHENHLVYAVPLAGIVVLYWREYWPIFMGLSAMVTINLLLFYGLGRDFDRPPRTGPFLPVTVVLSAINLALLWTHLRIFLAHTSYSETGSSGSASDTSLTSGSISEAIDTTRSPSARSISRTPCVSRPMGRRPEAGIRMI